MHPVVDPRAFSTFCLVKAALALRNFVCMVHRNVVDAAGVNIEMLAEIFHAHCGTFNMPARVAASPRRIPGHCLIFKLRFGEPKHKVIRVALVLIDYRNRAASGTGFQFVKVQPCKLAVIRVSGYVKIKVSVCHIGMAVCLKLFDKLNHLCNMLSRLAFVIRAAYIQRINVFVKCFRIKFSNFENALVTLLGSLNHFIFAVVSIACKMADISYVHNVVYFIAEKSQRLIKHIKKDISTQISDMSIIIDCRATTVKANLARLNRLEFLHGASHRVIKS